MTPTGDSPSIVVVPGLRDHVEQHWQTWLAAELRDCVTVPPMGRENLDRGLRVAALERVVASTNGDVVLVAHSGGCITVAHWAQTTAHASRVRGALLATPPDFDTPLPAGYPDQDELRAAGWFPVPRFRLPFNSLVALSENDPLGGQPAVLALAHDWGSRTVNLGAVGHLNPASGYGPWPGAVALIRDLSGDRW